MWHLYYTITHPLLGCSIIHTVFIVLYICINLYYTNILMQTCLYTLCILPFIHILPLFLYTCANLYLSKYTRTYTHILYPHYIHTLYPTLYTIYYTLYTLHLIYYLLFTAEPSTQMTLKTFHFAGVASMNVTLGICVYSIVLYFIMYSVTEL